MLSSVGVYPAFCNPNGHGKASRVRSGDEFLRIRAPLVFEAGFLGIGRFGKHTGVGGKVPASIATGAAPNRLRLADHQSLPS